jgi:hypothetical protein
VCGGGRWRGRCGWQCVGGIRHDLRLEGVGSELVEGVQRPIRKISLEDRVVKVRAGGTNSGVLAVAGSHHKGYEVGPIEGAQSRVDKQKRRVGRWPGARKSGVGAPGPPLPSGDNLVVLPGLRARERDARGGVIAKTLVGHAAASRPRVDLMDGGQAEQRGLEDGEAWAGETGQRAR